MKYMYSIQLLIACTLSTPALSGDIAGTLQFVGEINTSTCRIIENNLNIALQPVETSALRQAGATAGETPFQIELRDCSPGRQVRARFEPGKQGDSGKSLLRNRTRLADGGAQAVELQLLNPSDLAPLGWSAGNTPSQAVTVAPDGSATLSYLVRYHAIGPVLPGVVTSAVEYSLVYD